MLGTKNKNKIDYNQRNSNRLRDKLVLTESFILRLLATNNETTYYEQENKISGKLVNLISEIEIIIKSFENELIIIDEKISDHCNELRDLIQEDEQLESRYLQIEKTIDDVLILEKDNLLDYINVYEEKCLENLKTLPEQMVEVKEIFANVEEKLNFWKAFVIKIDLTPRERYSLYNSALTTKQLLLNSAKFFNSLLFLGQLPVYEYDKVTNKKQLKYNEFTYIDILNTDRLNINYKPGKIVYNSLAFTPNYQILKTMWMSLIHVDRIVICLQVFNQLTCLNEIIIKYFDNNGHLINENLEHKNCEVLSMITSEKFIIIAMEYFDKNHNFGKKYSIKLFDLNLNLSNLISIDYKPVLVYRTFCQIYIVTNKAPFIHVFDLSLEEKNSFGQDLDSSEPFYIPNVTQIYVRNEKLYVRD
jgi:hypothetical protein